MSDKKELKISNKSDKPDNIVLRDHLLIEKAIKYEKRLPSFMKDYFVLQLFINFINRLSIVSSFKANISGCH